MRQLLTVDEHQEMAQVRSTMMRRPYGVLRERDDKVNHWMTSTSDAGDVVYDPTLSGLDEATYQEQEATS
ncbi:hypothetical protein [Intrasporangium sp. YIM S08009]|uniref:hypothetical protein n=1 Tax=Intrasporangium zincisolvens TaxID=3080018 RepID=UPI002B06087A|nr:hypothetical protein [Intrasporangium sp. YIM S08009]